MDEAKAVTASPPILTVIVERLSPVVVLGYQFGALLLLVLMPFLTLNWLNAPFLGVLLEPNAAVSEIGPAKAGTWNAYAQGVNSGGQLVELDGQKVQSAAQVRSLFTGYQVGDQVNIVVQARSGHVTAYQVTLQPFPNEDRFALFYLPLALGVIYLGSGLWVMRARRGDSVGRAFGVFSASAALTLGLMFDLFTTQQLIRVWALATGLTAGGLVHLAVVFPRTYGALGRVVPLRLAGYLAGAALAFNGLAKLSASSASSSLDAIWGSQLPLLGLSLALFFGATVARRVASPSPIEQEQCRIVLWGGGFSLLTALIWLLGRALSWEFATPPLSYVFVPLAIFPLAIAYAILRYRMVNTEAIISRTLMYALLTVLAGTGYALLISGLGLLFNDIVEVDNSFLVGVMLFVLALMLNPLRNRLQSVVDALFFRGENIYREQVESFQGDLAQMVDLSEIAGALRNYIHPHLNPIRMHIFVYDQMVDRYVAAADETGRLTTDLRFPRSSGLVQLLLNRRTTLFISAAEDFPAELRGERPRLALLGAQLFVALPGQERLAGWLALGPRATGDTYSSQDLNFLATLAEQAAQAIERAQVMADKDRRVNEMNVLTRVAQGVNVTLEFDDILELLFAQTRQVIAVDDFNITLYNSATNTLRHALLVESDDRLVAEEDKMIPLGHGLEREVLGTRRLIITEDYIQECRNRRVVPAKEGVFAWMGVPLNAGAEIIGVIAVGSRNPTVLYTEDQYNILQAIADQAAGAIVKARLLDESERRARQLASLNEVTRGLTSTLELDPLLTNILESAVEILNCAAGSLLLEDANTGELVFEVVVGPVAEQILGDRLEPGVGLVGKAATEMRPVIVNNVEHSAEWHSEPDQETGFVTHTILAVPMVYKDDVIGVIEVINKKDRMPFNLDDQELLTAFAGGAAVAVENVRLYQQTDEELTSRVEELSVMQRIDRELNTSLDVSRAMEITLEWAMRQSKSNAGLVGVVNETGVQVVASEGYDNQLDVYADDGIPLDLPLLAQAVTEGRTTRMETGQLTNGTAFLENAQSQLVIPIRRENEVIGLMMLESIAQETYDEAGIDFLTRLSDHASIAIANAQLYSEVQRANIAKSDFVSFVSHELKTPMTSIRGYSDLLAAGAVGEVSEPQAEFLDTIRSNIDRMATLVSDLADVSRIEAGRLQLEFAPVDLREIVEEMARSTGRMLEDKQITLDVDLPPNLTKVWGDRSRLEQILTNLLSNAIKYTLEGGTITLSAREQDNEWDPDGALKVVHLAVRDSGIGIKLEDQKKIFTQYFRTDEGRNTAPGTGLGLNITRYLVEMQGGKIWFESDFDQGTTFYFTIPVAEEGLN